jgi:putative transposase
VFDETQHIRHITLKGNHNNNKMERLNGEIRDREKTMRGLKRRRTTILQGMQVYHNFIREHEGLKGKTPAEACGIEVEGENKWLTLIQNASKSQNGE